MLVLPGSSSWIGDGYHHFHGVPVIQHHNPYLLSSGADAHTLHEHPAPLVSYQGPTAVPVLLPSGHLADTPEVSHAKHHHLSAVAQARADQYYKGHAEQGYGGAYGYTGSYHGYAVPVVLPNGHIADTHEVAAAKSAHLLAVAKAKADKYYSGHGQGYGYGDHEYGYSGSFQGYGIPVVLPNGHLADTHEVAAAKSAHLLAVAHAKEKQAYHYYDDSSSHYEHHHEPYHYPLYQYAHYSDGVESLHDLQYLHYHE